MYSSSSSVSVPSTNKTVALKGLIHVFTYIHRAKTKIPAAPRRSRPGKNASASTRGCMNTPAKMKNKNENAGARVSVVCEKASRPESRPPYAPLKDLDRFQGWLNARWRVSGNTGEKESTAKTTNFTISKRCYDVVKPLRPAGGTYVHPYISGHGQEKRGKRLGQKKKTHPPATAPATAVLYCSSENVYTSTCT